MKKQQQRRARLKTSRVRGPGGHLEVLKEDAPKELPPLVDSTREVYFSKQMELNLSVPCASDVKNDGR